MLRGGEHSAINRGMNFAMILGAWDDVVEGKDETARLGIQRLSRTLNISLGDVLAPTCTPLR